MIHDLAIGVLSASSWARILTLIPNAGSVGWTVGIEDALGSATLVWIADVFRKTRARTRTVLFSADGVGTARRRLARGRLLLDWLS